MTRLGLRVIKLGGSLLETSDCVERLLQWMRSEPTARTLVLVGGGPPVDAIRQMANLHHYRDEFLHWLCIDAMDISFRLIEEQLRRLTPTAAPSRAMGAQEMDSGFAAWQSLVSSSDLTSWLQSERPGEAIVHVRAFYTPSNYRQLPIHLPLGWDTTSDSLAALLAHLVQADELIIVKSCAISEPYAWQQLADAGVVDRAFPTAVRGLPKVRVVDLNRAP